MLEINEKVEKGKLHPKVDENFGIMDVPKRSYNNIYIFRPYDGWELGEVRRSVFKVVDHVLEPEIILRTWLSCRNNT